MKIRKRLFPLFLLLAYCMLTQPVPKVHAETVLFTDSFENGLEKWNSTRGNDSYWAVIDNHLTATIPRPYQIIELVPKDEYWNQEWINIRYQFDFFPAEGIDRNISFRYQDENNWQEIHIVANGGYWFKATNGQAAFEKGFAFSLKEGEVNQIALELHDEVLTIYLNDEQIYEGIDPTWDGTGGKVGLKASTGAAYPTVIYWDNIIVQSLDDRDYGKILPLTQFKQSDSQWAFDEYDSASTWSNHPSIYHWGCALSSLASILNYHGINQLPDQSPMNPANLNTWLKSQPDGYIGQGLVNWLAATRLTYQMSTVLNTPKLEYTVNLDPTFQNYLDLINLDQPFILQMRDHFFMGKGYTADQTDIYTSDPIYDRRFLSQYPEILSSRLFTPSHTDLSYILIGSKSNITLTVKNSVDQIIPTQNFTERIQDDVDSNHRSTSLYYLYLIPKPTSDIYTLEFSQSKMSLVDLTLIAYDQQANPTLLNQSLEIGPEVTQLHLNYQKEGPSFYQTETTYTDFRYLLHELHSQHQFKKEYAFLRIDRIAQFAETATENNVSRYKPLLAQYLEVYHFAMTNHAYQTLLQILNDIES